MLPYKLVLVKPDQEQHLPLACAQTGVDLKLFTFLSESPDQSYSATELASELGGDPVLLGQCRSEPLRLV